MHRSLPILLLALALLEAHAVDAAAVLEATGVRHGFVVHVGSQDGALESRIAALGKGDLLVQGVCIDATAGDRARARFLADGTIGYASVVVVPDFTRLPYNDHLANVVVADLDAPGAPSSAEVMRVVRPLGVAYLRRQGAWRIEAKPMPKEMDDWTHYEGGADGNPQSEDSIVAEPRGLQWIATNCGGRMRSTTRLADGRWVRSGSISGPGFHPDYLWSRDAFNGLLNWRIPDSIDRGPQERMLVTGEGLVSGVITEPGFARILDAATGETVRILSEGLQQPVKPTYPGITDALRRMTMEQILLDGVLYQSYEDRLAAVRVADGKRTWDYTAPPGQFITWVIGGDRGVFVGLTSMPTRPIVGYGQQLSPLVGVVGFDAASGKQRWSTRIESAAPFASFGMVYWRGGIYTIDSGYRPNKSGHGYTKGAYGEVLRVDAASGAITMRRDLSKVEPKDDKWHHKLRIQNGLIVPAFDNVIRGFDPLTGADGPILFRRPVNVGLEMLFCSLPRGTVNGQISGKFARFADFKDGQYHGPTIARGSCQEGMYPGYGMIFTGSDGCGCTTFLRGGVALQCNQTTTEKPIAESRRHERGTATPLTAQEADAWPMLLRDNARTACGGRLGMKAGTLAIARSIQVPLAPVQGRIGIDWAEDNARCGAIAPPVIADGVLVTASVDAHQVHGYDARTGSPKWRWNAGARVSSSPTLHRGLVIFGSHDGRVTALRARDGVLVWRFLVAPDLRQVVVSGQVESLWPVHGSVVVLKDKVFVAAGRHNQIDGGVVLRRLDAATGAPEAQTLITDQFLSTDPPMIPYDDYQGRIADILTVNASGTLLYMGPIAIDPGTLSWVNFGFDAQHKKGNVPKRGSDTGFFGTNGPHISWQTPDFLAFVCAPSTGTVDRRVTFAGHKGQNGYRFMSHRGYESGYSGDRIARDGRTLLRVFNGDIYALDLNEAWLPVGVKVTDIRENDARRASGRKLGPIGSSIVALAVGADAIAVATNRFREKDFAIGVYDREGKPLGKLKLPVPVVTHGLAIAGGELFAALEDGRIVTLAVAP